jgi:hypothetical protein
MGDFLSQAINALPSVASSPLALIGYIVAVVAYVVVAYRVVRNRNLLAHLRSLPTKDRIIALQMEMRGAVFAEGLSPEEWIALRTRQYIFIVILITIALLASILLLVFVQMWGRISIDVGLAELRSDFRATRGIFLPSEARAAESSWDAAAMEQGKPDRDWLINYSFHKDGDRIEILPNFPYLDFQKAGNPAPGLISAGHEGTFTWKFPILAVNVANNTRKTLVLSKAHFVISNLKRDLTPILVAGGADSYGTLRIANEGWSPAHHAVLTVALSADKDCRKAQYSKFSEPMLIGDIDGVKKLDLIDDSVQSAGGGRFQLPRNLEIAGIVNNIMAKAKPDLFGVYPAACVSGKVNYVDQNGASQEFAFITLIYLRETPPFAHIPNSCTYNVYLNTSREASDVWVDLAQEIKPGAADRFSLRVGVDQSAEFDSHVSGGGSFNTMVGGHSLQDCRSSNRRSVGRQRCYLLQLTFPSWRFDQGRRVSELNLKLPSREGADRSSEPLI